MSSLKFGTSGLRGLVTDLVGWPSYAYAGAFFRSVGATSCASRTVVIGRDLRDSSAGIAATVATAAAAAGFAAIDCGALPTPALALEAMRRGACAVMVTGSHIPQDRNGLKFYRPDGEITKADEAAILAALGDVAAVADDAGARRRDAGPGRGRALPAPLQRGLRARHPRRPARRRLPAELGRPRPARRPAGGVRRRGHADRPLGHASSRSTPRRIARRISPSSPRPWRPARYDALVTTDGDADRPLVADGAGGILRGDVLGLITARVPRRRHGGGAGHRGLGDRAGRRVRAGACAPRSARPSSSPAWSRRSAAGAKARRRLRGEWRLPARIGRGARRIACCPPCRRATRCCRSWRRWPRRATAGLPLADLVAVARRRRDGERPPAQHAARAQRRAPAQPRRRGVPAHVPAAGRHARRRSTRRTGSGSRSTAAGRSTSAPRATRRSCAATPRRGPKRRPRTSWPGD